MAGITLSQHLRLLAELCAGHAPLATIGQRLLEAELACEQAAQGASAEGLTLLADVQMRLAMWRRVYPRLGKQPAFRAAVAREAASWVKRLTDGHVSI